MITDTHTIGNWLIILQITVFNFRELVPLWYLIFTFSLIVDITLNYQNIFIYIIDGWHRPLCGSFMRKWHELLKKTHWKTMAVSPSIQQSTCALFFNYNWSFHYTLNCMDSFHSIRKQPHYNIEETPTIINCEYSVFIGLKWSPQSADWPRVLRSWS